MAVQNAIGDGSSDPVHLPVVEGATPLNQAFNSAPYNNSIFNNALAVAGMAEIRTKLPDFVATADIHYVSRNDTKSIHVTCYLQQITDEQRAELEESCSSVLLGEIPIEIHLVHDGNYLPREAGSKCPGLDILYGNPISKHSKSNEYQKKLKVNQFSLIEEDIKSTIPIECRALIASPICMYLGGGDSLNLVHLIAEVPPSQKRKFNEWVKEISARHGILIVPELHSIDAELEGRLRNIYGDADLLTDEHRLKIQAVIKDVKGKEPPCRELAGLRDPFSTFQYLDHSEKKSIILLDSPGVGMKTDAIGIEILEGDHIRITHYVVHAAGYIPPNSPADHAAKRLGFAVYVPEHKSEIFHPEIAHNELSFEAGKISPAIATEFNIDPDGNVTIGDVFLSKICPKEEYDTHGFTIENGLIDKEANAALFRGIRYMDLWLGGQRRVRDSSRVNADSVVQVINEAARVAFADHLLKELVGTGQFKNQYPALFKGNTSGRVEKLGELQRELQLGNGDIHSEIKELHGESKWSTLRRLIGIASNRSYHSSVPREWAIRDSDRYANNKPHSYAGFLNQLVFSEIVHAREDGRKPEFFLSPAETEKLAQDMDESKKRLPDKHFIINFLDMLDRQLSHVGEELKATFIRCDEEGMQVEINGFKRWVDLEVNEEDRDIAAALKPGDKLNCLLLGFQKAPEARFLAKFIRSGGVNPRFHNRR